MLCSNDKINLFSILKQCYKYTGLTHVVLVIKYTSCSYICRIRTCILTMHISLHLLKKLIIQAILLRLLYISHIMM